MKISFHGADQGVTGSCHLFECAGKRVLVDCGLYQGGRELNAENSEPFGFDPASIDFLLLTHAQKCRNIWICKHFRIAARRDGSPH